MKISQRVQNLKLSPIRSWRPMQMPQKAGKKFIILT